MRIERKPILFKAMTEAYVLIMLMKNGVVSSVSNLNITIVAQLINHHPGIECDIIKLFTYIHDTFKRKSLFSTPYQYPILFNHLVCSIANARRLEK